MAQAESHPHQTEAPIEQALPEAEQRETNVASRYFSEAAQVLLGPDVMDEIETVYGQMTGILRANNEYEQKMMDNKVRSDNFNIHAYFIENPVRARMCRSVRDTIKIYSSIRNRPETTANWEELNRYTASLYGVYERHKNTFVPLAPEKISEDIERHLDYDRQLSLSGETLTTLYASLDQTTDETARMTILGEVSERIAEVRLPESNTLQQIVDHLITERVFAKFERLDKETSTLKDLLIRFGREGVQPQPHEISDIFKKHTFRSLSEITTHIDMCEEIIAKSRKSSDVTIYCFTRFAELIKPIREAERHRMSLVAARTLRAAESKLTDSANIELSMFAEAPFPFTMIERDAAGALAPHEIEALTVIAQEAQLGPVRQGFDKLFKDTHPNATPEERHQYLILYDAFRQAHDQEPYADTIERAKEVASFMAMRHLDTVQNTAQPAADVLEGRKPRSRKKNPTAEQQYAQQLYDNLHKAGLGNSEKSLVVSILTGQWEKVQRSFEHATQSYEQVRNFADIVRARDMVENHPVRTVVEADFGLIFKKLRKTLANPAEINKVLSSTDIALLEQTIPAEEQAE